MIEKMSAMNHEEFKKIIKNKNSTILELGMAKLAGNLITKGKTDFIDYIIPRKTSTTVESINVNLEKDLSDDPIEAANEYKDIMNNKD